jgi:hypothetical protein
MCPLLANCLSSVRLPPSRPITKTFWLSGFVFASIILLSEVAAGSEPQITDNFYVKNTCDYNLKRNHNITQVGLIPKPIFCRLHTA